MKYIILLLLAMIPLVASPAEMTMPIRGVADGDTIRSLVDLPCPLCAVSIRILGIDTPESNYLAKCPAERQKGMQAKAALKELIGKNQIMIVRDFKWDKYGGRINGIVFVNGVNIGQKLIDKGLARPYTGQGAKSNWCS